MSKLHKLKFLYIVLQILIILIILLPRILYAYTNNLEIIDYLSLFALFIVFSLCFLCINVDMGRIITSNTRLQDLSLFVKFKSIIYLLTFLGVCPAFGILLLNHEHGLMYLLAGITTNIMNDSMAYFCGKIFGERQFFPNISPRKTLEGSLGGLIFASLYFAAFCKISNIQLSHDLEIFLAQILEQFGLAEFFIKVFRFMMLFASGLLIAIAGQIGDLLESAYKRAMNVKDSGTSLGSHGGILDRIDSHFFSAPFIYIVFKFLMEINY